jgi:prepilin-type N-terminal cleavage/methylation domain-containing protein
MRSSTRASQSGFSLIELIVALAVTMLIMAGTFTAMSQAMKSHDTAKQISGMNSNLRVAMDIVIRDLLQTAQGMPTSKRVEVPNGLGAQAIIRPGPTAMTFVTAPSLPAISYGPNLGPAVDSHATDMITILLADAAVTNVPLRRITTSGGGFQLTVALPAIAGGINITDGGVDDLRVGDLIMLQRGSDTTLMYVSGLVGGTQDITMLPGDPLRLNQFDPDDGDPTTEEMGGTLNQVLATLPAEPTAIGNDPITGQPMVCQTRLTRMTMVTYYLAPTADPSNPALMRIVNAGAANAIGFGLDDFKITYDLVADGVAAPTNLRLVAADLVASGPCGPDPCTENQIRKVNVTLAGRSRNVSTVNRRYFRNTLFSQVSIRNLAFVDEY